MQPSAPIEPEGEENDVDGDALEQKFQYELKRESESIKNWKKLLMRVQIIRAFNFPVCKSHN